jgi:AcrR family transcriptional regulator
MPRTRPELNRDDKVAQILDAAEARLLTGGFEQLSMAGIARDLSLAQNAIYWYFPSRADLFVGALARMLERIAAGKPRGGRALIDRILYFTDRLAPIYHLRPAMQEQAQRSPLVADFLEGLDARLERMLRHAFDGRVPDERLNDAIAVFRATVVGAYVQGLSQQRRRRLLTFTYDRLTNG